MNIVFRTETQTQSGTMDFAGVVGDVPVGHALVTDRGGHLAELVAISLADREGGPLSLEEFAETFFRYLKTQGYTELWVRSEDMDGWEAMGFRMEERDNSGWYPKYYFRREL